MIGLRYGGAVKVVHLIPESPSPVRPGAVDPVTIGSVYEDAYSEAQEKMQRVALRLQGFSPHVRCHGRVSDIFSTIVRADELEILVAGTHGRTGLDKFQWGSVAEEIVHQVPCAVFTEGPKESQKPLYRCATRAL